MPRSLDLKGEKYGLLTVIEECGRDKHKNVLWKCRCVCGNEVIASCVNLRRKHVVGCLECKSLRIKNRATKHGDCSKGKNRKLYHSWTAMKERCTYESQSAFNNYGGRGIKICDSWLNYSEFKAWAENNGYKDGLSIDRIDVNGDYEPSNCRWATISEQARNKRTNVWLNFDNKKMVYSDVAKLLKIPVSTMCRWIKLFGPESALQKARERNHEQHNIQ